MRENSLSLLGVRIGTPDARARGCRGLPLHASPLALARAAIGRLPAFKVLCQDPCRRSRRRTFPLGAPLVGAVASIHASLQRLEDSPGAAAIRPGHCRGSTCLDVVSTLIQPLQRPSNHVGRQCCFLRQPPARMRLDLGAGLQYQPMRPRRRLPLTGFPPCGASGPSAPSPT